jgi:nitroreductase
MAGMDHARLSMPIGEAMFTQRSIRRFRPDPIPVEDLRLILEAAVRAPNGANRQIARFLVITDRERLRAFGRLYREAWWAKRREERGWTRPEDIPPEERAYRSAMGLADAMGDVPCVILAFALPPGAANSVIPADATLHFCIPLGYPEGRFGGSVRRPTAETTFFQAWGAPPPWA